MLSRDLARRELALLDARSEAARLQDGLQQGVRRQALLSLVMRKLSDSRSQAGKLNGILEAQERRHGASAAKLELDMSRLRTRAREATTLARRATTHLKRLQAASGSTQTITAHEPKSYGTGDAHTVSVVDQDTLAARRNAVSRVSNRDSARLSALRSSNEPAERSAGGSLQSIDGVTPAVERRLNAAGIHHVEQLAELSDQDADALDRLMRTDGRSASVDLQGGARRVLDRGLEQPGV